MESLRELELALWREACRHIDIAESIADLAKAIHERLPLRGMWVLAVDPRHAETISLVAASGGISDGASTGTKIGGTHAPIVGEDAAALRRFALKGELGVIQAGRAARGALKALSGYVGERPLVVCGGLCRGSTPEGVVMWQLAHDQPPTERALRILASTLEPLAVAVDTSRRFHELEDLRRAAEADRQSALRRLGRESLTEPVIGAGGGLRHIMGRVDVVAASDVPVLILGETGSGKEIIARAIHDRSPRHDGAFIRVNCGAIPPDLVDSQLFGHEKGSFTGATDQRLGWFERADGGTLFLDEIGELPLAAQVRLLRVVQEGTLERVGGQRSVSVDCRIVAATHRDLAEMVRARTFREDLWYRLAVFPLLLPPLRERHEDLAALARHFAHRATVRFGLPEVEITDDDLALLRDYAWPGNIRELAAVIDRAALLGSAGRLALGAAMGTGGTGSTGGTGNVQRAAPMPLAAARGGQAGRIPTFEEATRSMLIGVLRACRGKIEGPDGAAAQLDINVNTLRSKLKKLGISAREYRAL